jgi:hypothetical protein
MLRQISPAADRPSHQVCAAVGQNPTNAPQQAPLKTATQPFTRILSRDRLLLKWLEA